jgi:hypothetical protein
MKLYWRDYFPLALALVADATVMGMVVYSVVAF